MSETPYTPPEHKPPAAPPRRVGRREVVAGILGLGAGVAADRVVRTKDVYVSNEVPTVVAERLKQEGLEQWTHLYGVADHFRTSMGVVHPFLSEMVRTTLAAGVGELDGNAYPLYPVMRGEWGTRPMTAADVDDRLEQTHTEPKGLLAQQAEAPIRDLVSSTAHALPLLSLGLQRTLQFGDDLEETCGKYADACVNGDVLHLGRITSKTRASDFIDNIVHEANHPLLDDLFGLGLTAEVASRIDPARLTEYAAEMYGITEGFYRAFADAPYYVDDRRFGTYSVRGERMLANTEGTLHKVAEIFGNELDPIVDTDIEKEKDKDKSDVLLKQQDEYLRVLHQALRVQFGLDHLAPEANTDEAREAIARLINIEITGFFHWLHSPVQPNQERIDSMYSTESALSIARLAHQRAMISFYSYGQADSYASLAQVIGMNGRMDEELVTGELASEPELIEAESKRFLEKFGFTERGVHDVLLDPKTEKRSKMHVYEMPTAPAHPDKSHTLLDVYVDGAVSTQYFVQGPAGMTVREVRNLNPDYIEVVCAFPDGEEEAVLYMNREHTEKTGPDQARDILTHSNETARFEFPPSKLPEGVFASSVRLSDVGAYRDSQRTLRRAVTSFSVESGIEMPSAHNTRAFSKDLVLADGLYITDSYEVGHPIVSDTMTYTALAVYSEENGVSSIISNAFSEEESGVQEAPYEMYFSSGLLVGFTRFKDPQMQVSDALERMGLELVGTVDDVARLSQLRLDIVRGGLQVTHDSVGSTELVVTNLTYTPAGVGLEPPDLTQYARAEVRKKKD